MYWSPTRLASVLSPTLQGERVSQARLRLDDDKEEETHAAVYPSAVLSSTCSQYTTMRRMRMRLSVARCERERRVRLGLLKSTKAGPSGEEGRTLMRLSSSAVTTTGARS